MADADEAVAARQRIENIRPGFDHGRMARSVSDTDRDHRDSKQVFDIH
ncbi:MAG: hypothetical protein H6844_19455 [Alphaproteobacteria bacterium]|nr:hypothetical protein [Alphaproteobacteria bacterium]